MNHSITKEGTSEKPIISHMNTPKFWLHFNAIRLDCLKQQILALTLKQYSRHSILLLTRPWNAFKPLRPKRISDQRTAMSTPKH